MPNLRAVLAAVVIETVTVGNPGNAGRGATPVGSKAGLRFAIAGPHAIQDEVRFRVELPEAGRVRIDVFDIAGRRASEGIDEALPAGVSEVRWKPDGLAPGVYVARLSAIGRSEVVRFVRIR